MSYYNSDSDQLGEEVLPELDPAEIAAPSQTALIAPNNQISPNTPATSNTVPFVIGGLLLLYLYSRS